MEKLERVARALAIADGMHREAVSNDEEEIPIWTLYVEDARAAIAAMREPTEMTNPKKLRFPDQIIGADAHLQLIYEGWAVVRADHLKAMQDEIDALPSSTSRPRTITR